MKKIVVLLLTGLLVFSSCGGNTETSSAEASSTATAAATSPKTSTAETPSAPSTSSQELLPVPNFTLKTSTGEEVSLDDYKGKVVVLNFWASWCPPCKKEMPDFQTLYDEYDPNEVVILMLDQIGGRETIESGDKYIAENQFTFPVLYDEGQVGYSIFGITSLPTTIVIDKDGMMSSYVIGTTNYDTVKKMIEGAQNAQ